MSVSLEGLEDSFDNDQAEALLSLSLGQITYTSELLRKSMYDFDLETPEGIEKLMALLPIIDPEILKDIMTEIWPGYPTELNPRQHRMEIKGYLKDYLESYDSEDEVEQHEGPEGLEETSGEVPGNTGVQAGKQEPAVGVPDAAPTPSKLGGGEQTQVAQSPST